MRKTWLAAGAVIAILAGVPAAQPAMAEEARTNARGEVILPKGAAHKPVPDKYKRRSVRLATNEAPGTVIVDTHNRFLYFVEGRNRATRYGIGVGREGFGWSGVTRVGRKAEWPDWIPPKEMIARERKKGHILPARQAGGPDNPLGARALYLYKPKGGDTGFRIHGTNQPWSIGLNLSSGCIRMMNQDVEHLYSRVPEGSKVVVIGPGNRQGEVSFEDRGTDLLRTLFGG